MFLYSFKLFTYNTTFKLIDHDSFATNALRVLTCSLFLPLKNHAVQKLRNVGCLNSCQYEHHLNHFFKIIIIGVKQLRYQQLGGPFRNMFDEAFLKNIKCRLLTQ